MKKRKISLVLTDVDGTLVGDDKILTSRTQAAIDALRNAGIHFAITSGRPPQGMAMLFEPLQLTTPIAGFNGGIFVKPDMSIIEQRTLPTDIAAHAIDMILAHGLDAWAYRGNDWLITKPDAPHVAREAWTVKFQPRTIPDIRFDLEGIAKIVGVSDDHDKIAACESEAQSAFGTRATAAKSQPYYLDITHTDANKGAVVDYLSRQLNIPPEEIATLGDQPNDVMMFLRSGLSIAMGNASDEVKMTASAITDSANDEGFAKAIERLILGSAIGVG